MLPHPTYQILHENPRKTYLLRSICLCKHVVHEHPGERSHTGRFTYVGLGVLGKQKFLPIT
jgi:hypothetical protein